MVAATHNNPPMIGLLIEAGADVNAKNNQGQTAARRGGAERQSGGRTAIMVLGSAKSASAPTPGTGQGSTSQ